MFKVRQNMESLTVSKKYTSCLLIFCAKTVLDNWKNQKWGKTGVYERHGGYERHGVAGCSHSFKDAVS